MNNAKGLMDDEPLQFDCPECGQSVKTTIGVSRRNATTTCAGGHTIQLDGSGLDREIKKVEQSIDGLFKGLK